MTSYQEAITIEGIYPPALHPNSTIALLSPSTRLNTTFPLRLARSTTYLTTLGFHIKIIYTPIPSSSTHTQQIQHRIRELHTAFSDRSIKAIICTIGGLSSNELLPFIDWELIRRNPKIFCGYSDISVLHLAMHKMTGLRTFYGPAAIPQFGEVGGALGFTVDHFLKVVSRGGEIVGRLPRSEVFTDEFGDWGAETAVAEQEGTLRLRGLEKNPGWKWLRGGICEGRIIGGCLPSLLQLAGTKYWPDFRGKILFLETPEGEKVDGPLPLERTQSFMVDLMNLGVWDVISGLVFGRPTGYHGEELEKFESVVRGVCESREEWCFPVLFGVDVGHSDPIFTVPMNALGRLDSRGDVWEVLEAGVV